MMAMVSMMVFAGAMAFAGMVMWASIAPQWRHIARLASGEIEAGLVHPDQFARVERRKTIRRRVVPGVGGSMPVQLAVALPATLHRQRAA